MGDGIIVIFIKFPAQRCVYRLQCETNARRYVVRQLLSKADAGRKLREQEQDECRLVLFLSVVLHLEVLLIASHDRRESPTHALEG